MKLSDKIGLWADEKTSHLYFQKVPFRVLQEKALNLFIPICNHKDFETGAECKERGEPCWLPNYDESAEDEIEWICYEHMHISGFCRGCRQFWGGCEDFDFDPQGLCSNCRYDSDITGDDWMDEYDDDYVGSAYE
jgi:hypothetical protein